MSDLFNYDKYPYAGKLKEISDSFSPVPRDIPTEDILNFASACILPMLEIDQKYRAIFAELKSLMEIHTRVEEAKKEMFSAEFGPRLEK